MDISKIDNEVAIGIEAFRNRTLNIVPGGGGKYGEISFAEELKKEEENPYEGSGINRELILDKFAYENLAASKYYYIFPFVFDRSIISVINTDNNTFRSKR